MVQKKLVCAVLSLVLLVTQGVVAGKKTGTRSEREQHIVRRIRHQESLKQVDKLDLPCLAAAQSGFSSSPSVLRGVLLVMVLSSALPTVLGKPSPECTQCMVNTGANCIEKGCSLNDVKELCLSKAVSTDLQKWELEGLATGKPLQITSGVWGDPSLANEAINRFYSCLNRNTFEPAPEKQFGFGLSSRGRSGKFNNQF